MFRVISRACVVALVVLALGLATVSPASAAEARRPAPRLTSWVAQALTFVQGYLGGSPAKPLTNRAAQQSSPVTNGSNDALEARTGSCIDPMGNRVPCNQS